VRPNRALLKRPSPTAYPPPRDPYYQRAGASEPSFQKAHIVTHSSPTRDCVTLHVVSCLTALSPSLPCVCTVDTLLGPEGQRCRLAPTRAPWLAMVAQVRARVSFPRHFKFPCAVPYAHLALLCVPLRLIGPARWLAGDGDAAVAVQAPHPRRRPVQRRRGQHDPAHHGQGSPLPVSSRGPLYSRFQCPYGGPHVVR
jgi:hypothetical protein